MSKASMDEPFPLQFGVDSFDELLAGPRAEPNRGLVPSTTPTSVAISGPDGSGKSILALHLASTYWSNADGDNSEKPICLYISTDLSFEQADQAWKAFGLNKPKSRLRKLRLAYGERVEGTGIRNEPELKLRLVQPTAKCKEAKDAAHTAEMSLTDLLGDVTKLDRTPTVYFLDLQKQSAGDDWQFLNRLLGILDRSDGQPHLMVIDAVEGLEVLVGRRDAFGEMRTRRSRIAQLIRTAKRNRSQAHLVFIIEEARPNRRLPEQFVTDMVVRLRQKRDAEYLVRTIEIEKCRGHAHDRGEHQFVIRSGCGASTGVEAHVDEPEIIFDGKILAHLQVIKSLHAWNAERRRQREAIPDSTSIAPGFYRLGFLDTLLGRHHRASTASDRGVGRGSITLLLGDAGTFKSRLARHFLLQGLRPLIPRAANAQQIEALSTYLKFTRGSPSGAQLKKSYGAAVLMTTAMLDKKLLIDKFSQRLSLAEERDPQPDGKLILVRRLGVRYSSSAEFVAAVRSYIRQARQILVDEFADDLNDDIKRAIVGSDDQKLHAVHFEQPLDKDPKLAATVAMHRAVISARIRLVIDDLSIFLAAHPNIAADPLFLQSLILLLKLEQVTALIVATQPGSPQSTDLDLNAQRLRQLDERKILTWNVPFFGEQRVAITAMSTGMSTKTSTIYELRPRPRLSDRGYDSEALEVDSHFLMYSGLEEGNPRRIPLVVRLFSGYPESAAADEGARHYPAVVKEAMEQVFASDGPHDIVKFEPLHSYHTYASFATWLDDSRLDYSLVFQIDEFWSPNERGDQLMDLTRYWTQPLGNSDIYNVFKPHPDAGAKAFSHLSKDPASTLPAFIRITSSADHAEQMVKPTRQAFFIRNSVLEAGGAKAKQIDRIPYLWDFGFILASTDAWYEARDLPLDVNASVVRGYLPGEARTVGEVWERLCLQSDRFEDERIPKDDNPVSWQDFFNACRVVSRRTSTLPFHVDMAVGESVLSLLFELWASIDARAVGSAADPWFREAQKLALMDSGNRVSARMLVETQCPSLYLAMLEWLSVCGHFESHRRALRVRDGVDVNSVAAERHWYSTASTAMERAGRQLSVLRLPGVVSTRGDWHLAVAGGSRSELVAHRALDILSSRPLSLNRLAAGVGLPVRDALSDRHIGSVLTALRRKDKRTDRLEGISYQELLEAAPDATPGKLAAFRRGWLRGYSGDSTFLQRWLARAFEQKHLWSMPAVASIEVRRELESALSDAQRGVKGSRFDPRTQESVNREFEKNLLEKIKNSPVDKPGQVAAEVADSYAHFKKLACVLIDVLGPTGSAAPQPHERSNEKSPVGPHKPPK